MACHSLGKVAAAILFGSRQPLWADAILGLGDALGTTVAVLLIRMRGGIEPHLRGLPDVIRYLMFGATLGSAIAATIAAGTLELSSHLSPSLGTSLLLDLWIGRFTGAATVGPFILAWSAGVRDFRIAQLLQLLALLVVTSVLAVAAFTTSDGSPPHIWHLFPLLVLTAIAFDLRGGAASLVIMSAIAVWATTEGMGPFVELADSAGSPFPLLQQFLGVSAVTILPLSVVADERRAKDALKARQALLMAAEEKARARAEELSVLLDAVPAAVWVMRTGDDGELVGNRYGAGLLRLPKGVKTRLPAANNGSTLNFTVFDETGAELKPQEWPLQRAARGEVVRDSEERVVFRDGTGIDLLGAATPLYTASGEVRGSVGVFIDITERKAAEARERLLMREVDHRAKNVLTVVQALVRLTSADDIESFRKAVVGRISSLARTHSLLAENRWDGAELHQLIDDELAPYL